MGADLIMEYICVKHDLSFVNNNDEFWSDLSKALHKKLKKDFKEMKKGFEEYIGGPIDKIEATALIETIISSLQSNPRDIGWIRVPNGSGKHVTVFLTGGMSWGDDPTDSFGEFQKFNALFPGEFIDDVLEVK